MKREILDRTCCREFCLSVGVTQDGPAFTSLTKYPGEFVRVVKGHSLSVCMCDHCGADIDVGQECSALSIYTSRTPYFEWENLYIKPMTEDPVPAGMELEFEVEEWIKNRNKAVN